MFQQKEILKYMYERKLDKSEHSRGQGGASIDDNLWSWLCQAPDLVLNILEVIEMVGSLSLTKLWKLLHTTKLNIQRKQSHF